MIMIPLLEQVHIMLSYFSWPRSCSLPHDVVL